MSMCTLCKSFIINIQWDGRSVTQVGQARIYFVYQWTVQLLSQETNAASVLSRIHTVELNPTQLSNSFQFSPCSELVHQRHAASVDMSIVRFTHSGLQKKQSRNSNSCQETTNRLAKDFPVSFTLHFPEAMWNSAAIRSQSHREKISYQQ